MRCRTDAPAQRMMNRVSVEASFFKKLSAYENLLYGSKLYGVTTSEAKPRIDEILDASGSISNAPTSRWRIFRAACSRRSRWPGRC